MVRENPALNFWDRLLVHYRKRDWDRCIRELRPVLDSDEDALVPRMLCAGLHLAAGQPVLALLQYETLLPLAVGQGDFFAALAVQKRLDQLHPAAVTHPRRYEVLRRWFISLGRSSRVQPGDRPGDLTEAALLDLDAESFTQIAEACEVEGLDPQPRQLGGDFTATRLVLYGRAVWQLSLGDGVMLFEGLAEQGQTISVDPGLAREARLTLSAELPAEFLLFNEHALELLSRKGPAAAPPPGTDPVPADEAPAAMIAVQRPRLDPRYEPFMASAAPIARRRESHVAINLASGVARLGLVNTRVAPLSGRLVQFGPDWLDLAFAHADLRHLRPRLEGSCLSLQINLGAFQPPLMCTGRVRRTTVPEGRAEGGEMRVEMEILPLRNADRDRLAEAARSAPSGSAGGPMTNAA